MYEVIPYEVKVCLYMVTIIILTVVLYFKKRELDNSYFSRYYLYYYIILVANLLNMTFVTLFYHTKINDLVGKIGKKGDMGLKGEKGNKVSCYDSNLNIKKTKIYREIVILNLGLNIQNEKSKNIKKFQAYSKLSKIYNYIDEDNEDKYFNLEFLSTLNQYKRKEDRETIDIINEVFKLETRMDLLLIYLNKRITSNYDKKIQDRIGFYRPVGGNGFFPLGHSVFDVSNNKEDDLQIKMNAFIINGDIRFPKQFKIKLNFTNKDKLERQDKRKDIKEEDIINNGLIRNDTTKEVFEERTYSILKAEEFEARGERYVPMGELIVRNDDIHKGVTSEIYKPSINLMACINCKCAKKLAIDELELVGIKMSFKSMDNISKFFKNQPPPLEQIEDLALFSVWKTPMNTFVTHCIRNDSDLINNSSLGYILIDGSDYNNTKRNCPKEEEEEIERRMSKREKLSYEEKEEYKKIILEEMNKKKLNNKFLYNGYLNKKGIAYVSKMLKAIKIPKLLRTCYVIIHQHLSYFEELKYYIPNTIIEMKKIITDNINQLEKASKEKKKRLTEINEKLKTKIKKFEKFIRLLKEKEINQYTSFTSLFDDGPDNSNNNNNVNNIIQLLKDEISDYDDIRDKLEVIPNIINQNETLYDILLLLFPNGLETDIVLEELNFIQKEILKICKISFPPNVDVYIPKNECISYETVDLLRRKLFRKLNTTINRYKLLIINYDFESEEAFEKNCDSYEKTAEKIKEFDNNLDNTFGHIPNYRKLIETQDLEKFSNSRIKFIIEEYEKIIKHLEDTCNELVINEFTEDPDEGNLFKSAD